jgi:hypothetical protein
MTIVITAMIAALPMCQGNRVKGAGPVHTAAKQGFLTEGTEIKATEGHREGENHGASREAKSSFLLGGPRWL